MFASAKDVERRALDIARIVFTGHPIWRRITAELTELCGDAEAVNLYVGQLANSQGTELYKFPLLPNVAEAKPTKMVHVQLEQLPQLQWKILADIAKNIRGLHLLMNTVVGVPLTTAAEDLSEVVTFAGGYLNGEKVTVRVPRAGNILGEQGPKRCNIEGTVTANVDPRLINPMVVSLGGFHFKGDLSLLGVPPLIITIGVY